MSSVTRGRSEAGDTQTVAVVRAQEPAPADDWNGRRIGRYLLGEQLGIGGMGVVVRASDPALGRDVALKLLRGRVGGESIGNRCARLLREARAMAMLSHPNVLPVYDVELYEGDVVIAMELVVGTTLRDVLRDRSPPWPEILRLFGEAGRGLAAAHAVGLVHRDFKPANVLVGDDGRVRVTDFGLARETESTDDGPWPSSHSESSGRISAVTSAGVVLGTPRYMAPEQHLGRAADTRADQYAFCVALFEALYGAPPFAGDTLAELVAAKRAGRVVEPLRARARAVPSRVRRVVERGLRPDPADRFATMLDLLGALERTTVGSPRRRMVAAAALVGGLSAVAFAGTTSPCRDGPRRMAEVWNDDARTRLRSAFDETDPSPGTAERVQQHIDAFASAWVAEHAAACEATVLQGVQSAEVLDRRMACLVRQREALRATIEVIVDLDADRLRHAVRTADGLPEPTDCRDGTDTERPPTDDATLEVEAVRGALARVDVLVRAGRHEDAWSEVQPLIERARGTGFAPLVAEALDHAALAAERRGDYEPARDLATEAYFTAMEAGHDRESLRALRHLVYVEGYWLRDDEASQRWTREAEAQLERSGRDPLAEAALLGAMGATSMMAGRHDEGIARLTRVVEIHAALGHDDDLATAKAEEVLGTAFWSAGRPEDAWPHLQRALAIQERELGDEHPDLASVLTNLGGVLYSLQRHAEALPHLERALAILERVHGGDHPEIAVVHNHLAIALIGVGRHAEADAAFARSAEMLERTLGPQNQRYLSVVSNWGAMLYVMGETDRALEKNREALALGEAMFPPDHPQIADFYTNVALCLDRKQAWAESLALYQKALPILESSYGADSDDVAIGLTHVGRSLVELGRAQEALPLLERAVAIELPDHMPVFDAVGPSFALARALWDTGGDRARAVELATNARDRLGAANDTTVLPDVERWLTAHRG